MSEFFTAQAADAGAPSAVLHMVCGKIGAGKSTFCKRLAAQPRTVLVSEDDWLTRLYPNEIQVLADYVRCSSRLRTAMTDHLPEVLKAGVSVVLDFPLNTPLSRAWARTIFEKAGVAHVLHHLTTPDDVCKARLHARNLTGEHPFETTAVQFDEITSHFVAPGADEQFNVSVVD